MTNNKMATLTNALFEQLERLQDLDFSRQDDIAVFEDELERTKAVTGIADKIIGIGALSIKAAEVGNNLGVSSFGNNLLEVQNEKTAHTVERG